MKLAVVGCGAVTQQYLIPALAMVPECSIEWFVDTNLSGARQACRGYGSGNVSESYKDVISKVDGAIVAVPNFLHPKVSIDFLKAGKDVLCEKPIATNTNEALEMIVASRQSGARLSINLIRRLFYSYQLTKIILKEQVQHVKSITYEEGHSSNWPFSSQYALQREKSGGGVLMDWGTHSLDLLYWFFGGRWKLISYRDDGLGRIESNCILDFIIETGSNEIPAHIELSQTRNLSNKLVIAGDTTKLEVSNYDLTGVKLTVAGHEARIGKTEHRSYKSHFSDQVKNFVRRSPNCADGEEALKSLSFIEECYKQNQGLSYPWEHSKGTHDFQIPNKVVVIGASGFLGSRLVERLALETNTDVRAAIHTPSRGLRLARLPVEFVSCDLLDRELVRKAVKNRDIVVNCAKGRVNQHNTPKKVLEIDVEGTRNILEAAQEEKVKKLIHISSAAVYGFSNKDRQIDETFPFQSKRNLYVKSKIESENVVTEYSKRIPTVILRPTLIYGPYSEDWAVEVLKRIEERKVSLGSKDGIANLIYVDDVIDAISLAMTQDSANGKAFIINNDEEKVTWANYVTAFSDITGIPPTALGEN
ncbi:MAG TPA: NAD-dependent epimerase/dehydratase family protein, partial [Candidatus Acidoferrum sp.]|nr:NAD-dependent epimerase/dehydratase family protein [Candidatus Acidoferrum sp.]